MAAPLVTIVTPVFNQSEYIEATIKSVLSQTYQNIEYIIIDDGSTDGTSDILDKYKDVITIIHQNNAGQSAALNRGWSISKGSILGYISSDDILLHTCVEDTVHAFKNVSVVCTYCDYDLIDYQGDILRRISTEKYSQKRLIVDLVCLPGPGAFFRRESYCIAGGWRSDLHQIPDFEFWLRLSKTGDFLRIPTVLAQFRVHAASGSVKKVSVKRANEICLVIHEFYSNSLLDTKKKLSLSNAYTYSARSHFQSGRFLHGLMQVLSAVKYNFKVIFRLGWYRFLAVSLVRRYFYTK